MSGVSFSEILVVAAAIVIFVKPKDIPKLMRAGFRIAAQLRAAAKKIMDEMNY